MEYTPPGRRREGDEAGGCNPIQISPRLPREQPAGFPQRPRMSGLLPGNNATNPSIPHCDMLQGAKPIHIPPGLPQEQPAGFPQRLRICGLVPCESSTFPCYPQCFLTLRRVETCLCLRNPLPMSGSPKHGSQEADCNPVLGSFSNPRTSTKNTSPQYGGTCFWRRFWS